MFRTILILGSTIGLIVLLTDPAFAGDCTGGGPDAVKEFEAFASRPAGARPAVNHLCMEDAASTPRLVKRLLAACTTILARDPRQADCVEWSVKFGGKKLGEVDLFERIGEIFPIDAFKDQSIAGTLYEKLEDPRALPVITAAWLKLAADPRATSTKSDFKYRWATWRHTAIRIFGKIGGSSERAFLEEQARTANDGGVRRASARAVKAIEKRLGASK
jgi:hypothetical protein